MQHQQSFANPRVPFVGPVWKNLSPGSMIRIQGEVPPTADRFNINLHCGSPISDVAFHLSVRLLQNYIARNSLLEDSWGEEEDAGVLPILPGQAFEILILCDTGCYKVAINGSHFCEFSHRVPFQKVTHIVIDGEVLLHLIAFEDGSGQRGPSAPQSVRGGESDYYGPPRSPKPRRPPTPPGNEEEESGFEHFLETAGTIIAGAIATGAASTLIDSLTGHGHDHDQQQQRYQRPPSPQPPLQQLFSGGMNSHNSGQSGIGGAVGSILGSVAEQILKPKEHHH